MTVASAGAVTVSVINASYEPLGSTRLKRAMALVLKGDAVIEEADPLREVRHADGSFPWPVIIRLLRYVKVNLKTAPVAWSKSGVMKRDGFVCGYRSDHLLPDRANNGFVDLWHAHPADTVDHIVPRAKGGRDTWENTVACCRHHNAIKGDRNLEDVNMVLVVTPSTPTRVKVFGGNKHKRK